jgi:hypothetical protein
MMLSGDTQSTVTVRRPVRGVVMVCTTCVLAGTCGLPLKIVSRVHVGEGGPAGLEQAGS